MAKPKSTPWALPGVRGTRWAITAPPNPKGSAAADAEHPKKIGKTK